MDFGNPYFFIMVFKCAAELNQPDNITEGRSAQMNTPLKSRKCLVGYCAIAQTKEAVSTSETSVCFYSATSQKTPMVMLVAIKTVNLTALRKLR
jgi:hypothetical protein